MSSPGKIASTILSSPRAINRKILTLKLRGYKGLAGHSLTNQGNLHINGHSPITTCIHRNPYSSAKYLHTHHLKLPNKYPKSLESTSINSKLPNASFKDRTNFHLDMVCLFFGFFPSMYIVIHPSNCLI